MNRHYVFFCIMLQLFLIGLLGCSEESNDNGSTTPDKPTRPPLCWGKCDGPAAGSYLSPYEAFLNALNHEFSGNNNPAIEHIEEAYSVRMMLGEIEYVAPTHLFGVPVNVIPYSDVDNLKDAAGHVFERRDSEIAKIFRPGEIGYAIKNHRISNRVLDVDSLAADIKENVKLQDTHIGIVVGVMRNGEPGAITINNPQGYENGLFGNLGYPMIFVRPVFPSYLDDELERAFIDNIRTMILGFNTVSSFPGDYNGGDPLAANNPDKVVEHVKKMVTAIGGDEETSAEAMEYFEDPLNLMYCSELAHVAASAGLLVPLNDTTMIPLVGEEIWEGFKENVAKHNRDEDTFFTTHNQNPFAHLLELSLAPEHLKPVAEYAPESIRAEESKKLAFRPMTMADIVRQFLRTHVPRQHIGESSAPLQGALLEKMYPGILEAMSMDAIPPTDPRRAAVDSLFSQLVQAVSVSYENYQEYQEAIEPLMMQANMMVGPRDDTGTGLFVPPSLYHVVAQGHHLGGLLKLQYEGHGVHISHAKLKGEPGIPPEPHPIAGPDDPYGNSCAGSCEGHSPSGQCMCDNSCDAYGDCCPDYEHFCTASECEPECGNRECGTDPVCGFICGHCNSSERCENGRCMRIEDFAFGTISGRVVWGDEGEDPGTAVAQYIGDESRGVPDAIIMVSLTTDETIEPYIPESDSRGWWSVRVPPGRYSVSAWAEGHEWGDAPQGLATVEEGETIYRSVMIVRFPAEG